VRMSVDQRRSDYVFSAEYSGDPSRHDVVVRFALGGQAYNVDGELFEDGTGVAQLQDLSLGDATMLEPVQVVSAGRVELYVPTGLVPRVAGQVFDVAVSFTVDGSPVESC